MVECFTGYAPFDGDTKKKISSFLWWRTGKSTKHCGKEPFNILDKLEQVYNRFINYNLKTNKTVDKPEECKIMFNAVIKLTKYLLEPIPKERYSAEKILQILEIPSPERFGKKRV